MARRIDPRLYENLVDAHVFDRTGGPDDAVVDELLTLLEGNNIILMLPYSVKEEIEHPNTPTEVKCLAGILPYTERVNLTPNERNIHAKVLGILQGNARPGKHDRDACHIVESAKYGGYFITNDHRILRKAQVISSEIEVEIVTAVQFLNLYRQF